MEPAHIPVPNLASVGKPQSQTVAPASALRNQGASRLARFPRRTGCDVYSPYSAVAVTKPKRNGGERGPRDDRGVLSARIVAAARSSFAQHGWAGTTMRGLARDAEVDYALVAYYFSNKRPRTPA